MSFTSLSHCDYEWERASKISIIIKNTSRCVLRQIDKFLNNSRNVIACYEYGINEVFVLRNAYNMLIYLFCKLILFSTDIFGSSKRKKLQVA